jgi:hypothetical protein
MVPLQKRSESVNAQDVLNRARTEGVELIRFIYNWLRVLDTTERSQINQRICHQFHAIVPLLDAFKTQ